jgi:FkbM family methyltransferase
MSIQLKQKIVHAHVCTLVFFDYFGQWHKKLISYSYNNATFFVRPKTSDKLVIKEVWKHKTYSHPKVTIGKDSVVLDVGANIGAFSVFAAKRAKRVFAIEALPQNFKLLQKNLEANDLNNVVCENIALTSKRGKIDFYPGKTNLGGSSMYIKTYSGKKTMVEGITLDSFFSRYNIKHIDVMKMDIEGAEYDVLLNTKSLSRIKSIAMEFHEGISQDHTYLDIVRKLSSEGFVVYIPTPKLFIKMFSLGRLFAWRK